MPPGQTISRRTSLLAIASGLLACRAGAPEIAAAAGITGGPELAVPTLAALGKVIVPDSVDRVRTGGFARTGVGAGVYVADGRADTALASAHPHFCAADARGRLFRLAGSEITAEQAGAVGGAGRNDQPAIQAAIDYALAVGIGRLRFTQPLHEVWTPDRRAEKWGTFTPAALAIGAGDALELAGAPGGTTLVQRGHGGGPIARETQRSADGPEWRGHMLAIGTAGSEIRRVALRDLRLDGTCDYPPLSGNNGVDLFHKGICVGLGKLHELHVRDCTMERFKGEVFYVGGSDLPALIHVENLRLRHSPQCLWNPGALSRVTAINLDCENSYQLAEVISGRGHTYVGGRFAGGQTNSFMGVGRFAAGFPYWWPLLRQDGTPPWITFDGTRFEASGPVYLSSWVRGSVVTVDSGLVLGGWGAANVDLDIDAWADRASGNSAVFMSGAPRREPPVQRTREGREVPLPTRHDVRVRCHRTPAAIAAGRWIHGVMFNDCLVDAQTCRFRIAGDTGLDWMLKPPLAGFVMPLVISEAPANRPFGGWAHWVTLSATGVTTISPLASTFGLTPPAGATGAVEIDQPCGYRNGQRIMLRNVAGSAGGNVELRAGGRGLALRQTRVLRPGDTLELAYEEASGRWHEAAFTPREQMALRDCMVFSGQIVSGQMISEKAV